MVTDYDNGDVAERYKKTKAIPVRSRIEAHSFLKHIGDVEGKKVLDISEKMIALARHEEARDPLGIEYAVGAARSVAPQQDFDIAVAAYLLVYARDRDELGPMCRAVACRVRPGGRFITLTTNPNLYWFGQVPDYSKYGFRITLADSAFEGAPIELTVFLDDSSLVIENYYLPIEAYESALGEAGFRDVVVHTPELAPAQDAGDEGDYWDDYLTHPPAIVIECVRE